MNILLAGGSGYVGSRLIPLLIARNHYVEVVDPCWFGDHVGEVCKLHKADASLLKEDDLRDFDVVVWLAGLSNDPLAEFDPKANFIDNAAIPAYLGYIASRAGVKRYVHGGSCSVYGSASEWEHDEQRPPNAAYPYGVSKLQAEVGLSQFQTDDFSVILLRKGTVSGYSPRMRFDLLINTMYRAAILDHVIRVNNPEIWRPVLAIEDAVNAYIRAIEAPKGVCGVFNIVTENRTILDIAGAVMLEMNRLGHQCLFEIFNKPDPRNYRVSGEKALADLGFLPTGTISSIVRDIHAHRDEYGDFTNSAYYNIQTFKTLRGAA